MMQTASQLPDGTFYVKPLVEWVDFLADDAARTAKRETAEARQRAYLRGLPTSQETAPSRR